MCNEVSTSRQSQQMHKPKEVRSIFYFYDLIAIELCQIDQRKPDSFFDLALCQTCC